MIDKVTALRNIAAEGYAFAGDAADEITRLRAKIEQMEKQEPVAEWVENRFDCYPQLVWADDYKAVIGTKLYALPGSKGE